MVIGKRLTFAADLDKYLWKQASAANLVAQMQMLNFGKHPASIKAMDRFIKKILAGKRPELNEVGDFLKEKKSFASFRWRPVDGKNFVFYIQLMSLL